MVSWVPPIGGNYKWNVDGSSKGKPGAAGIGGVLRDSRGEVMCLFAASISIRDSNKAEFEAIAFAVEESIQHQSLRESPICFESDSRTALAGVLNEQECPWGLRFKRNKLQNMLTLLKEVTFKQRKRGK